MISLILCSHNGQDRILSTLLSLSKLNLPSDTKVELVFVDSNSTQSMLGRVNQFWEEQGNNAHQCNSRLFWNTILQLQVLLTQKHQVA